MHEDDNSQIINLIQDYCHYLEINQGYSDNTIQAYHRDTRQFLEYLEVQQIERISQITNSVIKNYPYYLSKCDYQLKTLRRKIISVRGFLFFLYRKKLLLKDLRSLLIIPRDRSILPEFLTVSEIQQLLEAVEKTDSPNRVRDLVIFSLLYSSGVRVSELAGLCWSDIDLADASLRIRGKGNKERIVYISQHSINALEEFRKIDEKLDSQDLSLFRRSSGKTFSRTDIYRIVKLYAQMLGLKKNIYPHLFRHSFATHLLNEGADIRVVQSLLGHSSLNATQIYTHVTRDKLKKVYQKHHPHA